MGRARGCLRGSKSLRARSRDSFFQISRQLIFTLRTFVKYSMLVSVSARSHHPGSLFCFVAPPLSSAFGIQFQESKCLPTDGFLWNSMSRSESLGTMVISALEMKSRKVGSERVSPKCLRAGTSTLAPLTFTLSPPSLLCLLL